jgi:hypothetical protein
MFSISKYARGLPSLLDLKERGSGPREFADQVVGTVDVKDLYLLTGRETLTSNSNLAPAVDTNFYPGANSFSVPLGEMWYVWEYSVQCNAGAGAALDFAACALFDNSTSVVLSPYVQAAATQVRRTYLPKPFWLPPGGVLAFTVAAVTLAPSVTGQVVVTRLKV